MILPSKKVLSAFILTAALVIAVIIAIGKDKSSQAINFASNLVAGDKMTLPENPGWQDELGKVAAVYEETGSVEDNTPSIETATDVVSRSLMSNYLALKQSGTLDQTSAQKLIDQTAGLIGGLGDKIVLNTNLNIIPDNGKQSMIDYGENLGNILKNNRPREEKNELEIISIAVNERNSSKIRELDGIIVIYGKIADEFVRMPVPQTFAKVHLDMTNGIKAMAIALEEAKIIFSDPIKGLPALQLYQEGASLYTRAIQAINTFISQNNIIYKQGSGGYYLLYGI